MSADSTHTTSRDVIKRNKATARRFYEEVWNKGNLDALSDAFDREVPVLHNDMSFTEGIENLRLGIKKYRDAFPDLRIIVDDQIAEANRVVNILTLEGTHTGESFKGDYKDFGPSGQKVTQKRIAVHRYNAEGKIEDVLSVHQPFISEGRIYK